MARRKSTDPNQMAAGVRAFTERMAGPPTEKKTTVDPAVSAAAKALSLLGASKGGKARAESLSTRRKKEIARHAAQKRWADHKKP